MPTVMKNSAKRRDIGRDLMAKLGLGQQHPGEKAADRRRQAEPPRRPAHAEQDQQRDRREQLRALADGDGAEQRAQHQPPDRDHGGDRDGGLEHGPGNRKRQRGLGRRERRRQHQERHHGEVLEQQDGDGDAPDAARHLAALGQELEYDRRRRQRQRGADHDRGLDGKPGECRDHAEHDARDHHLQGAEPEHIPANQPEPVDRQLQPDREQQEHHAELGEAMGGLRFLDQREAVRSDGDTGDQIAQHHAGAQPTKYRRRHHRGGEKDQHVDEELEFRHAW
jgi:hypothetical protein